MFPSQFQQRQHLPPLTLILCSTTSSLIIYLFTAVLIAICFSNSGITHAKIITSLSPTASSSKTKSCLQTKDCRDSNKECVDDKCRCRPYFDHIPDGDLCLKSYGASCMNFESSEEELCNTNKFLACDDTGTCSCHIEEGSFAIYDPVLETCAAPPGHQCEFMMYMDVQKLCVMNAKCVKDPSRTMDREYYGICECSKGFVGKGDKCVPEFGSVCELDVDCDQEWMRCVDGKCKCGEGRIYWEKEHDCKLKVGEACEVARRDCVRNAECRGGRDEWSQWEWKCQCKLGYHEIQNNGTCVKDWHDNCEDSKVYDEKRGRCSLAIGKGCIAAGVNICVMHAFCGTGNQCQCFERYEVTGNGTCEKKEIVNETVVGEVVGEGTYSSTMRIISLPSTDDGHKVESSSCSGRTSIFILHGIIMISSPLLLVITSL